MQRHSELELDCARAPAPSIAAAVRRGLFATPKQLPAWLFYDALGSQLFEQITELPEYYLSRAERSIFATYADQIIAAAARGTREPLAIAELGAGTATKTQLLLHAVVRRQGDVDFLASDVSPAPLELAARRLALEEPRVRVQPIVGPHERALELIETSSHRQVVLFIGSSIGNYVGEEATSLLRSIRRALRRGAALLLGTDLRKDPSILIPAYDDAAGVTAAFNKNVLARINRELGGRFRLEDFRHVALWNEAASRIEMHLESLVDQMVSIRALATSVVFRRGERIFTESSVKYGDEQIDGLLQASGFARTKTFHDGERRFGVHVAHAL